LLNVSLRLGRNAYDALLAVVGPAVFLGQAPSAFEGGDLASSGPRLGPVPSTPILQRSEYPGIEFWHYHEYKTHLELTKGESNTDDPKPRGSSRAAQGINVTMRYVQDANGLMIDGFRATAIRGLATKLFAMAEASGVAPPTWNKGSLEFQSKFSAEICQKFPEMELCANDWKVKC
jgi:hypothetical protein